jgi:hypothetical protein
MRHACLKASRAGCWPDVLQSLFAIDVYDFLNFFYTLVNPVYVILPHCYNIMDDAHPTSKPFRVVVVGAGIVGLSVSHALQRANIDHVVLEKYEQAVTVRGASLVILPNGARVLDQFGVLSKIHQTTLPANTEFRRWPDGSILSRGSVMMEVNHMYAEYPCQQSRRHTDH